MFLFFLFYLFRRYKVRDPHLGITVVNGLSLSLSKRLACRGHHEMPTVFSDCEAATEAHQSYGRLWLQPGINSHLATGIGM